MKILFILTQDLESPSGLGRFTPLATNLAKLGHQVTMIALHPDYHSLASQKFMIEGVPIHYVAPMHVQKKGNQKTYYRPWMLALVLLRSVN